MFSVPCIFIHSESPRLLLPVLSCVYLFCIVRVLVCVCVCVCVYAHTNARVLTEVCLDCVLVLCFVMDYVV